MKIVLSFFLFYSLFSFGHSLSSLKKLNGEGVTFDTTKKQLIVFWATWCSECRYKLKHVLPELSSIKDVDVLTINIDKNVKRVKHFIRKNSVNLPVLRDQNKLIYNSLKVSSVPHWAIYENKNSAWELVESEEAFDEEKIKRLLLK